MRGLLTVVIALLWMLSALVGCGESESSETTVSSDTSPPRVTPFDNVAQDVLGSDFMIWNDRPGIAVFDYDRDGDHDVYITSDVGHANFLYDNSGDGTLVDVASKAGVAATSTNSSGVVACDINNDGYQDLYVGALGVIGDDLDFRSATGSDEQARELRQAVTDRLFLNQQNGTFEDITEAAFRESANIRSTASIGCADVDSDGWLDLLRWKPRRSRLPYFQLAKPPGSLQPPVPEPARFDIPRGGGECRRARHPDSHARLRRQAGHVRGL